MNKKEIVKTTRTTAEIYRDLLARKEDKIEELRGLLKDAQGRAHEYGQLAHTLSEFAKKVNAVMPSPDYPKEAVRKMDLARGQGGYKHPIR